MKYVALDFETANASPISACAVGLSVFEDRALLKSNAYLIRPPQEFGAFNWFNIKVHGIRQSAVAKSPDFQALWPVLQEDIANAVIVCHNAMFDTAVLCKTLAFYNLPVPCCQYVCTVKVAQKVWPELANHKLDTVADALGISLNHHEAGSDALACGYILQAAMEKLGCADVNALADAIDMRLGLIAPDGNVSCSTAQEISKQRERAEKQTRKRRNCAAQHR